MEGDFYPIVMSRVSVLIVEKMEHEVTSAMSVEPHMKLMSWKTHVLK